MLLCSVAILSCYMYRILVLIVLNAETKFPADCSSFLPKSLLNLASKPVSRVLMRFEFLLPFYMSFYLFLNFILQAISMKYQHPDSELQYFALQVMDMLRTETSVDAQALVHTLKS